MIDDQRQAAAGLEHLRRISVDLGSVRDRVTNLEKWTSRVEAFTQGTIGETLVNDGDGTASWGAPNTYYAAMYAANSGSPTHTSNGAYQKVGSGGGTLTWTSVCDIRPSGVSAQVDTATNKRLDVRYAGVYRVDWCVAFSAISDAKLVAGAVYKTGAIIAAANSLVGSAGGPIVCGSVTLSLTDTDYLELYAYQNDSVSEAYDVSVSGYNRISMQYVGPAA